MTTETTTGRAERVEQWRGIREGDAARDYGLQTTRFVIDLAERNAYAALVEGETQEALVWGILGALRAMQRA